MSNHVLTAFAAGCAIALLVAPARADEAIDVPCMPIASVPNHEKFVVLSHDETIAARVLFYAAPTTPDSLPPGDKAMMNVLPDGSAWIVYLDGTEACAPLHLADSAVRMLGKVKAGTVSHPPGKM